MYIYYKINNKIYIVRDIFILFIFHSDILFYIL